MKHYFNPQSRAVTTVWMLAELEAPHEAVLIDFASGETASPEFRAINPMGKLPTLVDGDIVVTETAAICAYLADRFPERGMAPPVDSPERGRYYRYLFVPGTTLEPLLALTAGGGDAGDPMSAGWGDLERGLATIEAMTPGEGWALGDTFTTADVVFGGFLDFGSRFGWLDPSEKVGAYTERLRARPAYIATHPDWVGEG